MLICYDWISSPRRARENGAANNTSSRIFSNFCASSYPFLYFPFLSFGWVSSLPAVSSLRWSGAGLSAVESSSLLCFKFWGRGLSQYTVCCSRHGLYHRMVACMKSLHMCLIVTTEEYGQGSPRRDCILCFVEERRFLELWLCLQTRHAVALTSESLWIALLAGGPGKLAAKFDIANGKAKLMDITSFSASPQFLEADVWQVQISSTKVNACQHTNTTGTGKILHSQCHLSTSFSRWQTSPWPIMRYVKSTNSKELVDLTQQPASLLWTSHQCVNVMSPTGKRCPAKELSELLDSSKTATI